VRFRWVILAAGTFAQATYAASILGLAVIAPSVRSRYGLSLTQVGAVLAAPTVGSIATLYAWGMASDRLGERTVIGIGLCIGGAFGVAVAFAGSFPVLLILLLLAGAAGAAVNSASGRVILHWFEPRQLGLALGIRQTAVPIGGVWVAVVLPMLDRGDNPRPALLALGLGCVAGGVVGALVLREGPETGPKGTPSPAGTPLRDRGLWRLALGAASVLAPQVCLVGFLVLFLHDRRGLSTPGAAAVLAAVNVLGVAGRIGAGRWSDLAGSRLGPLRLIALASAALVLACTVLLSAPLVLLVPALILMGSVSISWNALAFAAVAEAAGRARSGTAIGLQQTVLAAAGSLLPIAFGALVAVTSWRAGYAVVAFFPLVGWRLLASLRG